MDWNGDVPTTSVAASTLDDHIKRLKQDLYDRFSDFIDNFDADVDSNTMDLIDDIVDKSMCWYMAYSGGGLEWDVDSGLSINEDDLSDRIELSAGTLGLVDGSVPFASLEIGDEDTISLWNTSFVLNNGEYFEPPYDCIMWWVVTTENSAYGLKTCLYVDGEWRVSGYIAGAGVLVCDETPNQKLYNDTGNTVTGYLIGWLL